jgi:hypothetical protein
MSPTIRQIVSATIAKLIAQKLAVWSISLGTLLLGALGYFRASLAPAMSDPTGTLALLLAALLLLSLTLSVFAYFWFRPKFEPTDFGAHKNIKTGAYFCSSCLIPNKVHSPMYLSSDGRFWRCHSNSNHKRPNPDFKEPELPPSPPPHAQSWMAR